MWSLLMDKDITYHLLTHLQVATMKTAGGDQAEQARKMETDQDKLVAEIFEHEDKDKDGFISHDEFSGPKHDEL